MGRYGIAAVIGGVYVVCAALVVHGMGQAHRDGLRGPNGPDAPPAVAAPTSPPPAAVRADDATAVAQAPTPVPPAATAVASVPPPAAAPSPITPPAAAAAPGTNDPPKQAERPRGPLPPDPWTDLAHLTPADERRLGGQIYQLILTYNRRLDSGPWLQRVVEIGRSLAQTGTRNDFPYTFTVLDSDEVNAFSHPGGFVYVTRGLFDLIADDEDYALEFVLGHEIAHVDLKHALKCLEGKNVAVAQRGLSTAEQFYLLLAFGYPEEQEFEADAWIYRRMQKRDRTVRESLAFLRKFQGYARSRGFENGRGLPPEKSAAPAVDNHFRAHPAAWDRLGHLKSLSGAPTAPVAAPPR